MSAVDAEAELDLLSRAKAAQRQGNWLLAKQLFGDVLAQNPQDVDALHVLGVLDYQAGLLTRALTRVEAAAALRPDTPEILNNLGTVYLGLKRYDDALSVYGRAVELQPTNDAFCTNLAVALNQTGQTERGIALAQQVLARVPEQPGALNVLGNGLRLQRQYAAAEDAFRRLVARTPQDPDAHYNLGVVLQDMWRLEEALACYDAAIALRESQARYHVNRGAALLKLHKITEAAKAYERGLALEPSLAEAHYNLAICRFLLGDLAEGAKHYEWRLRVDETSLSKPRTIEQPMWDGAMALDKTVLLHSEQGLGDMVQFVRFVRAVHAMVGSVILEVQRPLVRMLRDSFPGLTIIAKGDEVPPFDCHAPLMSLMHLLQVQLADLPASPVPYLKAQPERVKLWAGKLAGKPGRKIAIAWQGNPKAKVDRGRSIPLALFEPLLKIPGLRFICLQKNDGIEQLEALPPELRARIEMLGDTFDAGPDGFLDTLAVMENCDLVLTTDTALAHIAGGLGRPTWAMLKYTPDWRWMLERSDCPWYPTMRLFRQTVDGDWSGVMNAIAAELRGELLTPLDAALIAHQKGNLDAAEAGYRKVLEQTPQHVMARHHLGVIAYQRGSLDVAETHIRAALEQEPDNVDILANLVLVQKAQGRLDAAVTLCQTILERAPHHYATHNNLANLLRTLERSQEALPHYQAAIALNPNNASLHHNLGLALHDLGQLEAAEQPLARAVELAPNNPDFHFDYGRSLLMAGQWEKGWAEYEWRRRMGEFGAVADPELPRWDGSVKPNATLLIHAEQGLGDSFQFLRFVKSARARVGKVMLVVPPKLKALAATVEGVDAEAVYGYGEGLPPATYHIPLMSLPLALATTLETLPQQTPYLKADAGRLARWQEWRSRHPGTLIGLAWQGNPTARADVGRSLNLAQLRALADVPGVTFVSLQKGAALAQSGLPLLLPDAPFDEGDDAFADTAALMEQCDVVLTTDTSIAHLAGALGRPTWVMLKHSPDWRWMLGRADSPWYPTMRLFRQPAPGRWDAVVSAVKAAFLDRPSEAADHYQRGVAWHQSGRLDDAIEAYQATLAAEPNHVLAQLYLGVARYQQGRHVEAESVLRDVIAARPHFSEAWGNLALALKGQERLDDAAEAFSEALRLQPESADVHNNFGNLLTAQKKFEAAIEHYRAAIRLQPSRADSYQNLGNALGDLERYEEAIENYRRAIALRPHYLSALNGLGKAYRMLERFDEAAAAFSEAIEADPTPPDAWSNLGVVWRERGNYSEALRCYDEAIRRKPDHAESWGNRALALHYNGRLFEAEAAYREAVRLKPDNADSQFGLGAVLLTQGKYAEGWAQYEHRRKMKDSGPIRSFAQPHWNGEVAPEATLFLFAEQGFGDTLQFIRFVEQARTRVGRVVVEIQPSLRRLLSSFLADNEMVDRGAALPSFAFYCPLMSLPRVLGVTADTLYAPPFYLKAEPDLVVQWKEKLRLRRDKRPLIGLNWQGNPKANVDKGRSIPLVQLVPLLERNDLRFVVLQKNDGLEQIEALPSHLREKLEVLGDGFDAGKDAFVDSAAVMACLDMFITSDTALAHLAGATGTPCLTLLKFMPDWRWMTNRSDTPWYPSLRLIRQKTDGDWSSVVDEVTSIL